MMLQNTFFSLLRSSVKFIKPTFLNDELIVNTFFLKNSLSSIDLKQEILKSDKIICEIFVKLVGLMENQSDLVFQKI